MKGFPAGVRRRMLLRSLLVQGSWNYETLIGTGFAFTMLPALRYLYGGDPQRLNRAVERHARLFNSHPYLVTVAVGAVARMEADAVDPALVERFKGALRGSLGSLGDQLVWGASRPAALLLGIVLLLAGVAWWVVVLVFLMVYNLFNIGLRAWGLRTGAAAGLEVGRVLRDAPLQPLARRAADVGAFLAGMAVVLSLAPLWGDPPALGAGVLAAALGLWFGLRSRRIFIGAAFFLWLAAIIQGSVG